MWKQLQQIPGSTVDLGNVELDTVINEIAQHEKCGLMTPADLKAVVDSAYLLAVHEHLDTHHNSQLDRSQRAVALKVTAEHLKQVFVDTRPSISLQDRQFYENIHHRFQRSGNNNKSSNGHAKHQSQEASVMQEEEEAAVDSQVVAAEVKSNRNGKKKKGLGGSNNGTKKGSSNGSSKSEANGIGILDQKFILK